MALTLEVIMDFNRRTAGRAHPSLSRQGDRWVSADLSSFDAMLTTRLDRDLAWVFRADADGGTYVVRGTLGTNEFTVAFEPKAGPEPTLTA